MSAAKLSQRNNTVVSLRAIRELDRKFKKRFPTPAKLPGVIQVGKKRAVTAAVTKEAEKFKKTAFAVLLPTLKKGVNAITLKALTDQKDLFKKKGIKLTNKEILDLRREFNDIFLRKKYFKKSPVQRVAFAAKKGAETFKQNLLNLQKKDLSAEQIRFQIGALKSGRGFSAHRSGKRAIVSEIQRAQAEVLIFLAEKKGIKYMRWVTMRDARVSDLDVGRERAITVSAKVLPGVDRRGVYTTAAVKKLIRHPFCRCTLAFIFTD